MYPIRSLLLATTLSAASVAAFAQTAAQPTDGTPAPVLTQAPAPQPLTAPGSNDPLVQKRNANAQANAEYRQAKKTAKSQYKAKVQDAQINRKADRQANDYEMKEQMGAAPAQAPQAGAQQ